MRDDHPLWLGAQPLVLASGSRTRFDLLVSAGVPVKVIRPDVDERALAAPLEAVGKTPRTVALHLARAKALAGCSKAGGALALGADQTLALGRHALHKPRNRQDAARQLAALSGQMHRLHSAVALAEDGQILWSGVATARLTMRSLSKEMIERYLEAAGDAVFESVGGYQLERLGVHLFETISGDHSTILGLPMLPLLAALRRLGRVAA